MRVRTHSRRKGCSHKKNLIFSIQKGKKSSWVWTVSVPPSGLTTLLVFICFCKAACSPQWSVKSNILTSKPSFQLKFGKQYALFFFSTVIFLKYIVKCVLLQIFRGLENSDSVAVWRATCYFCPVVCLPPLSLFFPPFPANMCSVSRGVPQPGRAGCVHMFSRLPQEVSLNEEAPLLLLLATEKLAWPR